MSPLNTEEALRTLLDVQAADLKVEHLHHRREGTPEVALRAEHLSALRALDEQGRTAGARLDDLEHLQELRQTEIDAITSKMTDIDRAMHAGKMSSPRDVQAMQSEIEALTRRRASLEDNVLELMEEAESIGATLAGIEETSAARRAEVERLDRIIADATGAIDEELATVTAEREALAASVPRDLLDTYERLRARLGGVGVARLDDGRCLGCHLALPSVELDAIRHSPEGTLHFHEECGRLLVR